MAFQFHRNGMALTHTYAQMRTPTHTHTWTHTHAQHLGSCCGQTGMWLNIYTSLQDSFFFTLLLLHNFYYYPDALRETNPPPPPHTHAHTYAYLHTLTYTQSSTVSSLPAAIIPLQDRQINYGLLDLETIMIAAWPPQWSLKVSWLPLPASLKRHVSGWHY